MASLVTTTVAGDLTVTKPNSGGTTAQQVQKWTQTLQNTLLLNMYGGATDLVQLAATNAEQNISIVTEASASLSATTTKGIYIKSGGSVGIGTVGPLSKLNVLGTQGNWRVDPDSVSNEIQVLSTTVANDGFRTFRLRTNETIIDTSGSESLRVDTGGNLILSKSGGAYVQLKDSTQVRGSINVNNGSDGLVFTTGSSFTERMRIAADGNVGIGTDDPDSLLHVHNGQVRIVDSTALPSYGARLVVGRDTGQDLEFIVDDNNCTIRADQDADSNGNHNFILDRSFAGTGDNNFQIQKDGTSQFLIDKSGNVGIGESAPDKPLHIKGTNTAGIVIENTTNATNMDIDWYNNVGSVAGRIRYSEGTGDFSFMPNQSTNAVVFRYDGNVGINTSSPSAKLHVESDGSHDEGAEIVLKHANNNTTDVVSTLSFQNNSGQVAMIQGETVGGNTNGEISFHTDNAGTSAEAMRIDSDHRVQLQATDFQLRYTSGSHIWYNRLRSNGTFAIHKNGAGDYLRVDSSGNVGIGLNALSSANLHVNYSSGVTDIKAGFLSGTAGPGIRGQNTSTTANTYFPIDFRVHDADARIAFQYSGTSNQGQLLFITENNSTSPSFGIYDRGDGATRVLVNDTTSTTAPNKTFEVKYLSTSTNVTQEGLSGGGAGKGLLIYNAQESDNVYANLDFRARNADGRIAYQYKTATNVGDFHFITDNTNSLKTQMIIKNDGKVGIGTDDPASLLHVGGAAASPHAAADDFVIAPAATDVGMTIRCNSNAGTGSIFFADTAGNAQGTVRYNHNTDYMSFYSSGDFFFDTGAGSVGIGTVSPNYKLQVVGTFRASDSGYFAKTSGTGLTVDHGTSFGTITSDAHSFKGNVDIRSATGQVGLTVGNTTGDTRLQITSSENSDVTFNVGDASDMSTARALIFELGSSEKMRISPTGLVGIGTNAPSYTIQGNGTNGGIIGVTRTTGNTTGVLGHIRFGNTNIDSDLANIEGVQDGATDSARLEFQTQATGAAAATHMTIKSTGLIGIGTDDPATKLHVYQTAGNTNLRIESTAANSQPQISFKNDARRYNLGMISTDKFVLEDETGGGTRLTVDTVGNVGIGTNAPATKLDIWGGTGARPTDPFGGQNQVFISQGGTSNAGITISADNNAGTQICTFIQSNTSASAGLIGTQSNHGARIRTNNTDRITILSGGSVGIGTDNPTQLLEVDGNIRLGDGNHRNIIGPTNATLGIYSNPNDSNEGIKFSTDGGSTIEMFLQDGGNVGIGTETPKEKLHISNGSSAGDGAVYPLRLSAGAQTHTAGDATGIKFIQRDQHNDYGAYFRLANTASNPNFLNPRLEFGVQNTNTNVFGSVSTKMVITGGGSVGIGTVSPPHKLSIYGTGAGKATVQIEGEGGADPYINFLVNNTTHWAVGADDSASDSFKISQHSALGTNDRITVLSGGSVGIGTNGPETRLHVEGSSFADAQVKIERSGSGGDEDPALTFSKSSSASDGQRLGGIYFGHSGTNYTMIRGEMAGSAGGRLYIITASQTNPLSNSATETVVIEEGTMTFDGALNPRIDSSYTLGTSAKRWSTLFVDAITCGGAISGTGANITSLNGSNISSGTVPAARLGSGSSITTKFLRGDNTWQTVSGGSGTVTSIATSGAITGGTITTSGTISHSTANGFKHIPSNGANGQFLRYSSAGTAAWASGLLDYNNFVHYVHRTSDGSTNGGSLTGQQRNVRTLNAVVTNNNASNGGTKWGHMGGASVGESPYNSATYNNQIILDTGTYFCMIWGIGIDTDEQQIMLVNTTASKFLVNGMNSDAAGNANGYPIMAQGTFTLSADNQVCQIEHWVNTTPSSSSVGTEAQGRGLFHGTTPDGAGGTDNDSDFYNYQYDMYTSIMIWKVG